jgi:hypothetical protein
VTLRKTARIAGIAYLFIIVVSLILMVTVDSRLVVPGNAAATATTIAAHELRFRIGALTDLFMYASVVLLSVALYIILKTVDKNLALLAFSLRMTEAILGGVTVLVALVVLQFLNGGVYLSAFNIEQLQALVQTFLNVRTAGYTINIIFTGLGSIVFLYLLFKSRYVPRVLAGYGIVSYSLMLAYTLVNFLVPRSSAAVMMGGAIEIACYAPGFVEPV